MKTGEGKTLVATLPCYLNALAGRGVHVVTVNDYLAKRDAEWMGKIYGFLGLTVGVIVHDLDDEQRREAYAADITYGTNNEFGFDYLRDNMKFELKDCVQRGHYYASSTKSTPSSSTKRAPRSSSPAPPTRPPTSTPASTDHPPSSNSAKRSRRGRNQDLVRRLRRRREAPHHHRHRRGLGEDRRTARHRQHRRPGKLGPEAPRRDRHQGPLLYKRDVEYVVKDGEVIIVDEFTGRLMPGRRWSDGLHQAVEAKEGVKIRKEDQTLATITFQNYFRLYKKLSGMTGTAETEAAEFDKIYKLEIVVIPTNKPMLRIENSDVVYRTAKEKYFAVADEIARSTRPSSPSWSAPRRSKSPSCSRNILQAQGRAHVVLNAKFHEREAEIVAQAGRSAWSPSPPTWPAAVPTFCSAATPSSWPSRIW
jgi:preprotein translocase subunit SecA